MPKFIVEISQEELNLAKMNSDMEEWSDAEYIQRTLEVINTLHVTMELETVKVNEYNNTQEMVIFFAGAAMENPDGEMYRYLMKHHPLAYKRFLES